GGRPEQRAVQAFAPDGADQPLDEWMREWRVRNSLDFGRVENPQIPLPLLEPIQRGMVRADVGWRRLAARRAIEHAAQPDALRHSPTPSEAPRCTPTPTMRGVQWSITTSTQGARKIADSQRNKSSLHRLSFA